MFEDLKTYNLIYHDYSFRALVLKSENDVSWRIKMWLCML